MLGAGEAVEQKEKERKRERAIIMKDNLALDFLIERCNLLAHHLQTDYTYKLTKADFDLTLKPLAILHELGLPGIEKALIENGLELEAYGFLIGWFTLASMNRRTIGEAEEAGNCVLLVVSPARSASATD
jgi:hypothetical protein